MLLNHSALLLFAVVSIPAFAANDFMGDLMSPPGLTPGVKTRYEYRHYGNAGANSENFQLGQSKFDISGPLANNGKSSWRAHAAADYDDVKTKARFHDGRQLPNRLWDVGGGFSLTRRLEGDRVTGGNFTLSSSGDQPFSAGRDFGFSLNFTYKVPAENEASWIYFLSMSNTRGFLNYIPLPGFAYSFKAGERTRMVLGIPFAMIFWRPGGAFSVSFFYLPIRTAELRIGWGNPRGFQLYSLASFRTRNFRLHNRTDKEERLFNDEGLFQAGVNLPVSRAVILDIGGGLSCARRYFLAKKATEHNTAPLLKVENAPFAHIKATAAF